MDLRHARAQLAVDGARVKVAVLLLCHLASQCSGHTPQWCAPAQMDKPMTFSCSTKSSSYSSLRWDITNSSSDPDLVTPDPGVTTTLCDSIHSTCLDLDPGRYEVKDTSTESRLQSSLTIRKVTQNDHGRWVICHGWNIHTGQSDFVGACRICVSSTGGGPRVRGMASSKLYNPNGSNESPGAATGSNTGSKSKMFLVKRSTSVCRGFDAKFIKSDDKLEIFLKRTEIKGGDDTLFNCNATGDLKFTTKCTVRCNSTNGLALEEFSPNNYVSFKIQVNLTHPWFICSCSVQSGPDDCVKVTLALFVLETNKKRPTGPNPFVPVYYITAATLALVILPVVIGLCVFIYRHGSDLYSYYYHKFYHSCPPLGLYEASDAPARPPPRLPPRQSVHASVTERNICYNDTTEESDSWTEEETPLTMPGQRNAVPTDPETLGVVDGDGYLKPRKCFMKVNNSPSKKIRQRGSVQTAHEYKEINLAKPPLCGVERRASADARAARDGWCRSVHVGEQSKRGGRGSRNGAELELVVSEAVSPFSAGHAVQSITSHTGVKGHFEDQTPVKDVYGSNTCLKGVYDSVTNVKEPYKSDVYLKLKHDDNHAYHKDDNDSITFIKQLAS